MPGSRSPHHDDFNRGRRTAALKYFSEGKQQLIRKEKTLQDILGNWFFEIKEFGQTPEREEKKMKRKLMTMLLALCLVVTMMPAMTSTAAAISSIEKVTAEITAVEGGISALNPTCTTPDSTYSVKIEKVEGKKRIMRIDGKPKYIWSTATSFEPGKTYRLTVRFSSNYWEGYSYADSMQFSYSTRPSGAVDAPAVDVTFKINGKTTTIDLYTSGNGISDWAPDDGNANEMLVQTEVEIPKVAVSGITLNNSTLSLTTGQNFTLQAMLSPSNATNKEVTWESSDAGVAAVSKDGVVTAKKAGKATIVAKAADESGKYASCVVTVTEEKKEVTGVTLNKSSLNLGVGGSEVLSATVLPADATNKQVTWLSSTPSVATVSQSGVVTGVKEGTTQISVITAEGSKTAICSVTVSGQAQTEPGTQTGGIIDPATGKTAATTFSGMEIELDYTSTAYNGSDKEPGVAIQDASGNDLTEDVDYTLDYYNNLTVGKATVIVSGKGKYAGVIAGARFTIKPKTVTVKSVKKASSRKLNVVWASHKTQTTGFQVRYATTKKFKSGTYKTVTLTSKSATSKALTKLKAGKTYYVKVRAYKTVDGKKIYSSWSKVKSAKA